jgi:hypothetical protein
MKSQVLPVAAPTHSHHPCDRRALRSRTVGALKGAAS